MSAAFPARWFRAWSFGVVVILLVSLVNVAFLYSPSVYGVDRQQTVPDRSVESRHDFEVGENDFRISDMGNVSDISFGAYEPAIAYNDTNNEYLTVWHGNDVQISGDEHIYGQRIDGKTGTKIGSDVQISAPHQYGASIYDVGIVYNQTENEYLVVWISYVLTGESEPISRVGIFARRVDATTGEVIGEQIRVDRESLEPKSPYEAEHPTVAYNPTENEYLVVWEGNLARGGIAVEIFGQRLAANGDQRGVDDFQISAMGPAADWDYEALKPDVAYNVINNEYLVVWEGVDDTGDLVKDEQEIFGQRLDGTTGVEVGVDDFRISDMGPVGDPRAWARDPSVIYNPMHNEYVLVWAGKDNVDEEDRHVTIYGQRIDAQTGLEIGTNDFRVSSSDNDASSVFWNVVPAITYAEATDTYLVVWTDNLSNVIDAEFEIVGQRLDRIGQKIGHDEFRISDMGTYSNKAYEAILPAVIDNPTTDEYLTVWQGDDNTPPLIDDEYEIFGQRLAFRDDITPTPTAPPECDPARDVWGKIRGLGWVEIGNRSETCTYPVGGAIYIIPSGDINDPDIDSQVWYDDTTTEVGPSERIIVRVDVPVCAVVQQDAFWGETLKSLDGQRYGERLLAAARYRTGEACTPTLTPVPPSATTAPVETATPEVPSPTVSPVVPTHTSPAVLPTTTSVVPTITPVGPTPTATSTPDATPPSIQSRIFVPLIER